MAKILLEANANEVETKLLELTDDATLVKKLLALGEPFKRACKVLGYSTEPNNGGNPILAFVLQEYVIINLIKPGLLNANTFKAIYNAVAKQLVADSEFFAQNSYNIIYCKNLYKKSPKEIEEYLTLQKSILKPSAEVYSANDQLDNRKTFLYIKGINNSIGEEELNIIKRANAIKKLPDARKIPSVFKADLNSIELARQIHEGSNDYTIRRNADELDKIVEKLPDLASKFAAILLLCTKSAEAKGALGHSKFRELNQRQIANAFIKLSSANVLPRGQLQKEDASLLVGKILATLETKENQDSTNP
jgi:hypothetical protein